MHPIQTAISVREAGGAQLTVTPDRSQAGTSLVDGQIELLVHRRLLGTDYNGGGVGDSLFAWNSLTHGSNWFWYNVLFSFLFFVAPTTEAAATPAADAGNCPSFLFSFSAFFYFLFFSF